jgi:hypothetical protein
MLDTSTSSSRWAAWTARGVARDRSLRRRAVVVASLVGGGFAMALLVALLS